MPNALQEQLDGVGCSPGQQTGPVPLLHMCYTLSFKPTTHLCCSCLS